jgi:hypothetical protein
MLLRKEEKAKVEKGEITVIVAPLLYPSKNTVLLSIAR